MSEKNVNTNNIDLYTFYETERKFTPLHRDQLADFRNHESLIAIEQVYLSEPDEPYSLRLRSIAGEKGMSYEATLKDRGVLQRDGIHRLEVTTPISPDLYRYYADEATPRVRKLRVEPVPDVTIDFYEDGTIQIESENELRWCEFIERYDVAVREVTGLPEGDNELRAYRDIRVEAPIEASVGEIVQEIVEKKSAESTPTIAHIGGRSGSGKSTIVRDLVSELAALGIASEVLSTDDYHRGTSWLTAYNNGSPWEHWDDPIVYDTAAMARDLRQLAEGHMIERRTIDWHTVEPQYMSLLSPADVIIIEGIYATAPEITGPDDIVQELPTPLATCVGRRLLRDITQRPQFADPARSLHYMLSEVEPAYRKQRAVRGEIIQ